MDGAGAGAAGLPGLPGLLLPPRAIVAEKGSTVVGLLVLVAEDTPSDRARGETRATDTTGISVEATWLSTATGVATGSGDDRLSVEAAARALALVEPPNVRLKPAPALTGTVPTAACVGDDDVW